MLLLDVDVLIKCSCYRILSKIRRPAGTVDSVLGVARYVVRDRLERDSRVSDRTGARQYFEDYLQTIDTIEPTSAELELAAAIEFVAQRLSLDVDTGESQLFAVAVTRGSYLVLTGDKRAIGGAEQAMMELQPLSELRGRLICLEQIVGGIAAELGVNKTRLFVCAEPRVDIALSICFSCAADPDIKIDMAGLKSYVDDLRGQAPIILYEADFL